MTDSPFGLIYPCNRRDPSDELEVHGVWEDFARHPSPLYQAFAEGVVLFAIMWLFTSKPRPTGAATGVFLIAYGACGSRLNGFVNPMRTSASSRSTGSRWASCYRSR